MTTNSKEYQRKWEQANRDKRQVIGKRWRKKIRKWHQEYKRTLSCERCGFSHPDALVFHHRNPDEKFKEVSVMVTSGYSIRSILKECAKCDVLCANCHAIEHAGIA